MCYIKELTRYTQQPLFCAQTRLLAVKNCLLWYGLYSSVLLLGDLITRLFVRVTGGARNYIQTCNQSVRSVRLTDSQTYSQIQTYMNYRDNINSPSFDYY